MLAVSDLDYADPIQQDVRYALSVSESAHVQNRTTYVGDFVQILGNEFGLVDFVAIRGARALRQAAGQGTSVDVVAHSQGTMAFYRALDLVDSPHVRRRIRYQGFGPEMFVSEAYLGLGDAENTWNRGNGRQDRVPLANYLPSPAKMFGIHCFLPGHGGWQMVDSPSNQELRGQEGNMHSFFYYVPFIQP